MNSTIDRLKRVVDRIKKSNPFVNFEEISVLSLLNKLSEEDQLAEVEAESVVFPFIDSPSEAVQLAAVNQNGYLVKFIDNPSESVQLAAVNEIADSIRYIKAPSDSVLLFMLKNRKTIQLKVDLKEEVLERLIKLSKENV